MNHIGHGQMTKPEKAHIEIRSDQFRLADEVCTILTRSDHAYLEAPTGSGKSLTIGLIADQSDFTRAIYTAPTVDLVRQAANEINAFMDAGLISSDVKWQFMTWQKYASTDRRNADLLAHEHLLFADECHLGGSKTTGAEKLGFAALKKHASKIVWTSATPWNLDEELLGSREDHTAYLSYDEAFRRGLLNNTQLVRVDCSLNLKIRVRDGIAGARQLHRYEREEVDIDAFTADDTYEVLNSLAHDHEDRALRPTDVPHLVSYRYHLMADIYADQHIGRKAIFWLPSKRHARDCAQYLSELIGREDAAVAILGEPGTTAEGQFMNDALKRWVDPHGDVDVACVVFRLREGFDYPNLALGFDCAWNPFNYRNAVQKIGRLIRKATGKPISTYYYAVDAISIAAARNRQFQHRFLARLQASYSVNDVSFNANTLADTMEIRTALQQKGSQSAFLPESWRFTNSNRSAALSKTPLFDVLDGGGTNEWKEINLQDMFQPAGVEWAERLVEDILNSLCDMPAQYSAERQRLEKFTRPSQESFREDLRDRLVEAGHLRPTGTAERWAHRLVDEIIEGTCEMPARRSAERNRLDNYINPSSSTFRPQLRERLVEAGYLPPSRSGVQWAEKLIDDIINGVCEMPSRPSADRIRLDRFLAPSSPRFKPELRDRLEGAGLMKPAGAGQTWAEEFVADIEQGVRPLPGYDTLERNRLDNYITPSGRQYRPDLRARLLDGNHIRPNGSIQKWAESIVEEILSGKRRMPPHTSSERVRLNHYLSPSNARYRPDLRAKLVDAGYLRPANSGKAWATKMVENIVDGQQDIPPPGSKDRVRLNNYLMPSNRSYIPELREMLIKAGFLKPSPHSDVMR